ncbi:hypothetical protein pb186bvf_012865 [Paramecium bursaria]
MEQSQYLTRLVFFTRTFIKDNYQKLPVKAPQFVESLVSKTDDLTNPYVEKITQLVDSNINKSFQIVHTYEQKVVEAEKSLVQKGKILSEQIKDQSKKAIQITVQNGASQYVLNKMDLVADKVLGSIEDRIKRLQRSVNNNELEQAPQNNERQNYQRRVTQLASNIGTLSYDLVKIINGSQLVEVRSFVSKHQRAVFTSFSFYLTNPALRLYTKNKEQLHKIVQELSAQYTNQNLIHYLNEQLQSMKPYLTPQQFKEYTQLLYSTLINVDVIQISQKQLQQFKQVYTQALEDDQEPQQNTELVQESVQQE